MRGFLCFLVPISSSNFLIEFAFKFDVFRCVRNKDKSFNFKGIRRNKFTKIGVDQLVFRVTRLGLIMLKIMKVIPIFE